MAAPSGCVVTSAPDFQGQDECVPFFLTHQAEPSTSEPIRQTESVTGATTFSASVPMRSCALTKEYTVHVFVDNVLVDINKIPPSEREVRDVSILVDLSEVTPGCHRVEAYASTNFAEFRTPVRDGDITKITWLYFDDPDARVDSCGAQ